MSKRKPESQFVREPKVLKKDETSTEKLKNENEDIQSLAREWSEKMTDLSDRKSFLKELQTQRNKLWDKTDDILHLKQMFKTNSLLSSLIQQLPLELDFKKRGSYHYRGSNGICADDVRDRYTYLEEKLSELNDKNSELDNNQNDDQKYRTLLLKQEKLRFEVIQSLEKYNKSLQTIQKEMKAIGKHSEFEAIRYWKFFPNEITTSSFPIDYLNSLDCGHPSLYIELAFDILMFDWDQIKKERDAYYRVRFAEY